MQPISQTFHIAGMTCEACQRLVAKKIRAIADVTEVLVDKDSGITQVLAEREVTPAEVQVALEGTYYSLVV